MKFSMKTLARAAALATLATAGLAQAAIQSGGVNEPVVVTVGNDSLVMTLKGGTGALKFNAGTDFVSNGSSDPSLLGGLVGALNVGKVVINGVDQAIVTESFIPDIDDLGDPKLTRSGVDIGANVTRISADNVTGQITLVEATGGARQVGTRISGTLNGGFAEVKNLRFDLLNKMVYADLVGQSAAVGTKPAVNYGGLNQALWSIGAISGPTVLPTGAAALAQNPATHAQAIALMEANGFTFNGYLSPTEASFSAINRISGLKVTQGGFDFFKNSLGLLPTGVTALAGVNNDPAGWGEVNSKIDFTVSLVPEPSTYAMTLTGLVLVGALARRRRRQA